MSRTRRNLIYHIYNRGNRKSEICKDKEDFIEITKEIEKLFLNDEFDLLCYCIMPNHYHILINQIKNVPISYAMQILGCKYTKYFNRKYKLVGHLFQGQYKCKAIRTSPLLNKTYEYIISNPRNLYRKNFAVYKNKLLLASYIIRLDPRNSPIEY